ncbi:MAG: leucine-rich repeat domain-containing protein [Turicibacter sp.]
MTNDDEMIKTSNLESIYFESNETQLPEDIKYILDYRNQRMYFKRNGIDLYLTIYDKDLFKIIFTNSNSNVQISSAEMLVHKTTYPASNLKNINNYKTIKYNRLYPNIDLVFEENHKHIQQTFTINPNGNPNEIKIDFPSSERIKINTEGKLIIEFRGYVFNLDKLKVFQQMNGSQIDIEGEYVVHNKNVGFNLGNYDKSQPVFISATFDFSLISNDIEEKGFYLDKNNNQYIVIQKTQVKDLKTVKAYIEAIEWVKNLINIFKNFMTEEEALTMIATWLQGAYRVNSVILKKLDASNQLVLIIKQLELAFEPREIISPAKPNHPELAFEPRDTMLPSVTDIVVDDQGNLYICANVAARQVDEKKRKPSWYPTRVVQYNPTGNGDGAILKLNSEGLVFNMSYFGGNKGTEIASIALYQEEIWITGSTSASDLQVTNGSSLNLVWSDLFVTHFNQDVSHVLFSTYIGGQMIDYGKKILIHQLKDSYEVYVIGNVENDVYIPKQYKPKGELGYFPTTPNAMQKELVPGTYGVSAIIKMSATGNIIESTLFDGGLGDTCISTAAVDASGNLYIAGTTKGGIKMGWENSERAGSQVPMLHKDQYTGFICKIDSQVKNLLGASYLGGSTEEYIDPTPYDFINPTSVVFTTKQVINQMALGPNDDIYLTGKTGSVDFPTTIDGYQPYFSGGTDVFICKVASQDLSLTYSTFFGGSGADVANQIAVSEEGTVYLVGHTYSTHFENLTEDYSSGGSVFELVLQMNQPSQVVNLEKNLKIALNKILNRSENQDITQHDLRHLPQKIDLSHSMITDLTGLEYAKYMKELNLSHNNISDITPIHTLPYLEYLDISENNISNLTPLKLLPQLETYFVNQQIVTKQATFTSNGKYETLHIPFITIGLNEGNTNPLISNISDNGIYDEEKQMILWENLSVGDQVNYNFDYHNGFCGTVYVDVIAITPVTRKVRYRYVTPTISSGAKTHSLIYGAYNFSNKSQLVRVKIYDVKKRKVVHKAVICIDAGRKETFVFGKIPAVYKVVFEVRNKAVYLFSVPRIQGKRVPIKRSYVVIGNLYDNHNMKRVKIK